VLTISKRLGYASPDSALQIYARLFRSEMIKRQRQSTRPWRASGTP